MCWNRISLFVFTAGVPFLSMAILSAFRAGSRTTGTVEGYEYAWRKHVARDSFGTYGNVGWGCWGWLGYGWRCVTVLVAISRPKTFLGKAEETSETNGKSPPQEVDIDWIHCMIWWSSLEKCHWATSDMEIDWHIYIFLYQIQPKLCIQFSLHTLCRTKSFGSPPTRWGSLEINRGATLSPPLPFLFLFPFLLPASSSWLWAPMDPNHIANFGARLDPSLIPSSGSSGARLDPNPAWARWNVKIEATIDAR